MAIPHQLSGFEQYDGSAPSSDIDLDVLHAYSSLGRDEPWVPRASNQQGPDLGAHWHSQSFPGPPGPFSDSARDAILRPQGWGSSSNVSATDSGYHSQYATSGGPSGPYGQLSQNNVFGVEAQHGFLPVTPGAPAKPRSVVSEDHLRVPSGKHGRPRPRSQSIPCPFPDCTKISKNNSDAQKHRHQHEKPYRCDVAGCSRHSEGFATVNDLERHRKSVHGSAPRVGRQTGYICRACHPPAGSPPKFWPRRDNFKAHIKRKHPNHNIDQLVSSSESIRPDDAVTESGYGTAPPSQADPQERINGSDVRSPLTPDMPEQSFQQGDYDPFAAGRTYDMLAGSGGQFADPSSARYGPDAGFHEPSGAHGGGLSVLSVVAPNESLMSPTDVISRTPTHHVASVPNVLISQYNNGDDHQTLFRQTTWGSAGTEDASQTQIEEGEATGSTKHPDGDYVCEVCQKRKKRECDLRKHKKRHTRPYGCTFPNCWKRFGSRNDWKRHESSQHFLQEMWRCNLDGQNGNRCGKLFYHVDQMQNHLVSRHQVPGEHTTGFCENMRIGREGYNRFWCGFCNTLKEHPDELQFRNAPESRLQHIGDHFDKDHRHINDWVCIEENKQKHLISKEDRRRAKDRSHTSTTNDDSDLGDHGIPLPFVDGYTVPPQPLLGHGPDMPMQGQMYTSLTSNKRRRIDDMETDADNVSDSDWQNGFRWTQ